MLGGNAGPHPAPGPPPAAAGAQAPGPPLLPHAVHCKEARGRWLGRTPAPPTDHPPTNQELQQFCDHSSLALPWAPGLHPLAGCGRHGFLVPTHIGYLLWIPGQRDWDQPRRKARGPPLLGAKECPGKDSRFTLTLIPPLSSPPPDHEQEANMAGLVQEKGPKHMDTQIDIDLYMDTDTKSSHSRTQLCPSPLQAPATAPCTKTPSQVALL